MDKELFDYIVVRANTLATSDASKQETKDAAKAWISAVKDADDATIEQATNELVDFLDGRPNTIDSIIAFAQGPAIDIMGKEAAEQFLAQQIARKEQGEKYCNCDACSAAVEVLAKFDRI